MPQRFLHLCTWKGVDWIEEEAAERSGGGAGRGRSNSWSAWPFWQRKWGWRWWVGVCSAIHSTIGGIHCSLWEETTMTRKGKKREIGGQRGLKENVSCCLPWVLEKWLPTDLWDHPHLGIPSWAMGTTKTTSAKYTPPSTLPQHIFFPTLSAFFFLSTRAPNLIWLGWLW